MGAFIEVRPRSGHKGAVLINVDEIRLVETLESSHLGKYTAIHFRREAPPTAIDAHESYEVIKGLIAVRKHFIAGLQAPKRLIKNAMLGFATISLQPPSIVTLLSPSCVRGRRNCASFISSGSQ